MRRKYGNRLRRVRESRGLTQVDVAKALGITQTMVSYHENGFKPVTEDRVRQYAALYNASPLELFINHDPDELELMDVWETVRTRHLGRLAEL